MEFQRAFSSIRLERLELKPKAQIFHDHTKGYSVYFSEKKLDAKYLFSLERIVASRGLVLEEWEQYWVVRSKEEF